MSKNPERDQKVLLHLLSFLNHDDVTLKPVEDQNAQSEGKLKIQSCLVEMLELVPDKRLRIAKELEPYKDDAIPVLVEALNLDLDHVFMRTNAMDVLEIIGDYRVIPPVLDKFDEFIEYGSITPLLKKIVAREGNETRLLVVDRLIKYLVKHDKAVTPSYRGRHDHIVEDVIDTLMDLDGIDDPRLPSALEAYIKRYAYKSRSFQTALIALSEIDAGRAVNCLEAQMSTIEGDALKSYRKITRTVLNNHAESLDQSILTICVREQSDPGSREIPYAFKYQKPLVYFLEGGADTRKFHQLAGGATSQSEAVDVALDYLGKWLPEMKVPVTYYRECNNLLNENLPFKHWGFHQSCILPRKYPVIIYDSPWCRIKFSFEAGDRYDETIYLQVDYGRLHAPSDDHFMIWNGEKCWCWHRVDYALNFLDGLSPQDAIKVEYQPRVIEEYRNSNIAKNLSAARWTIGMVSAIWQSYGKRLFELFDLGHPEIWAQFTSFIKEFYSQKKSNIHNYPANDKIC